MSDVFATACAAEGVPSSLAAARDGIDAVLRDRGLRRTTPEDTAQSLLLGAAASAALEGDVIGPEELASGGGGATARDALHLSSELLSYVSAWRSTPLQVVARLHALAAAGSVDHDQLGRPAHDHGRERLQALASRLTSHTAAPALGVAAIVHAEIVTAAPFATHNGIVARAAERLVLVERGVDPASVLVPELGHYRAEPEYRAALEAYSDGSSHIWLLYAADSFLRAVEAAPLR